MKLFAAIIVPQPDSFQGATIRRYRPRVLARAMHLPSPEAQYARRDRSV